VRSPYDGKREGNVGNGTGFVVALAIGTLVLARGPARAQEMDEPDPCRDTVRLGDVNKCWAREAERAGSEMKQLYLTALEKLPHRQAENLKKAQKLWEEFRDAHIGVLMGDSNPLTNGPDYAVCLSILRWRLARERTAELKRILKPDDESMCPL
jgi:uncharacterized protein YecT (DUF1311 family)